MSKTDLKFNFGDKIIIYPSKTKAVYIHHYQPRKIPTVHELAELMVPIPVSLVADGDVIEI